MTYSKIFHIFKYHLKMQKNIEIHFRVSLAHLAKWKNNSGLEKLIFRRNKINVAKALSRLKKIAGVCHQVSHILFNNRSNHYWNTWHTDRRIEFQHNECGHGRMSPARKVIRTRFKLRETFGGHGPEKILARPVSIQLLVLGCKCVGIRLNFQKNITLGA